MRVFAIDPSVNYLGWAIMEPGFVVAHGTVNAVQMKEASWTERIGWMIEAIDDVAQKFVFDTVAMEQPETWGAYKSMASSRSGSLQILTLLVGALTYWAILAAGVESVKLIKVSQHKGQLPKRVTQSRMERKYNVKFNTSHEADACSVGNYCLERNEDETKGTRAC